MVAMSTLEESNDLYLLSYGQGGQLGLFAVNSPETEYHRGMRVIVSTERGKETGTVLKRLSHHHVLSGLQGQIGKLIGPEQQFNNNGQDAREVVAQKTFDRARAVAKELFLPVSIIDVEVTSDLSTAIIHLVHYGQLNLAAIQGLLTDRCGMPVLLHDLTNPEILEELQENGCSNCGNGCGSGEGGSCSTGSCSSNLSPHQFHIDWQQYFAELRKKMESRLE